MTDIKIVIEPSELTDLYGVNNDNVSFLSRLFPQLKLLDFLLQNILCRSFLNRIHQ